MVNKKYWIFIIICIAILFLEVLPIRNVHAMSDDEEEVLDEIRLLVPTSLQMVASAVEVLSKGLSDMTPVEREQFESIFDPSDSGTIDQEYVEAVLDNYAKIQRRFEKPLSLEYQEDSDMCNGMRLYYVVVFKVHVCPYIHAESDVERKARVLVHEVAHMALMAGDRPYYHPKTYSASYNKLSPRGSGASRLPIVGLIFREISRSDTLYHPDAYAWFASLMVSSQPSAD